jgi:acetyl-CoA acetyltransferase family protein
MVTADEGIRFDASLEKLAGLKTVSEGGVITAGNASQITDGAAAVLVCNEAGLKKINANPRAEILSISVVGDDPVYMLTGPIPASHKALSVANLSIDDIDLYEVNEAFAPVPLSWAAELKADRSKLNVNGGAMALGHPLGATGAKLMTTLLHELERREGTYALQAICEGGGTANATIIRRVV